MEPVSQIFPHSQNASVGEFCLITRCPRIFSPREPLDDQDAKGSHQPRQLDVLGKNIVTFLTWWETTMKSMKHHLNKYQ